MKAQEQIKRDGSNIQADAMTDLPVTDEQGVEVKGGAGGGYGILIFDTTSSMNTVR
jgi:hypothetical protein